MPFPLIPAVISGIGALGGLFGGKKSARTGTTTNKGTVSTVSTSADQPEYTDLRDLMIRLATKRLGEGSSLLPYQAAGITNINRNAELARMGLLNRMTSSGLGGSPVQEAGLQNLEDRRFTDINQLENIQLPMLQRELQNQDFDAALRVFGQQRPTTTTTGTTDTIATGVEPGSALGSGLQTASGLLALLYGMNKLGQGTNPSPWLGTFPLG
jgi:hypothetical protein